MAGDSEEEVVEVVPGFIEYYVLESLLFSHESLLIKEIKVPNSPVEEEYCFFL